MDAADPLKTCSLWGAFDRMQLCYTISPQAKSYYRYGKWRDCSLEREDFNLCWQLRGGSAEAVDAAVSERDAHRRKMTVKQRASIGIWQLRTTPQTDTDTLPDCSV